MPPFLEDQRLRPMRPPDARLDQFGVDAQRAALGILEHHVHAAEAARGQRLPAQAVGLRLLQRLVEVQKLMGLGSTKALSCSVALRPMIWRPRPRYSSLPRRCGCGGPGRLA